MTRNFRILYWLLFAALATTGLAQTNAPRSMPANANAPALKSLLADDEGLPIDPQVIEIIPQTRAGYSSSIRSPNAKSPPVNPVAFMLAGTWRLTSVKVVAAQDLATNKTPTALWHMISDSNSIPVKTFMYGERIRGMKPSTPRARPEPLLPDVKYTLLLQSGSAKGQTNFQTSVYKAPRSNLDFE